VSESRRIPGSRTAADGIAPKLPTFFRGVNPRTPSFAGEGEQRGEERGKKGEGKVGKWHLRRMRQVGTVCNR